MEAAVQIVISEDCEDFRSDLATYGGCRSDSDLINDAEFQKVYKEAMGCVEAVEEYRPVYCETCEMWLNGDTQWLEHLIGRKHKKNLKRDPGPEPKSEGLVVPIGTVVVIEQTAIYTDAIRRYMSSLYERGLLRSRI